MSAASLAEGILTTPRFIATRRALVARSLLSGLEDVNPSVASASIDWNYALACASALAGVDTERAQEAALRVSQGCLAASRRETQPHHREAAAVLLERMGNGLGLRLAERRGLVEKDAWLEVPGPLKLDVIRRRLELGIPVATGTSFQGNAFQRDLWTVLGEHRWVSVSAPTSAGKSYLIKRWFEERAGAQDAFRGVYLVPTRALIDEVSRDLLDHFDASKYSIHSIPWDPTIGDQQKEIHVLTQERLHLWHERFPTDAIDLLFVDEAQKFGDGERGVLLQRVIDEAVRRSPDLQVVFASPQAENPAVLLEGAPEGVSTAPLARQTLTVNQNLVWVEQVRGKPKRWELRLVVDEQPEIIGTFELPVRADPRSQRLPLVAVALGTEGGNVVYVNRPSDAEKAAIVIHDALGPKADVSDNGEVEQLRELVRRTIHQQYALDLVLSRGVGFHYGNMPLLVRTEIERLFRAGVLRFLVCTATLLEGVNLPCRNVFARGPRKGNKQVMTPADFWNLAGRAGRWGQEFEGNIFCVDATDRELWPQPPVRRARHPLTRVTARELNDVNSLIRYVAEGAPVERALDRPLLESMYSYLASRVVVGLRLADIPHEQFVEDADLARLEREIASRIDSLDVPPDLITRHAGISPAAMQRLLDYFATRARQDDLALLPPADNDALQSYISCIGRCAKVLGANFGRSGKRHFVLGLLVVNWMRGYPLARLIQDRIQHTKDRSDFNLAAAIRGTMQDVEQEARFRAPKYLACYSDILRVHLERHGHIEEAADVMDISMMLELGVSRPTHVSLMTLGLSRTAAIAVGEFIAGDDLTPEDCLSWLRDRDVSRFDLPALVRVEIERMLRTNNAL